MAGSFDGELQGVLDRLRLQHERMVEVQRGVAGVSATAVAAKRACVVTVGAQGEVRELSFPTEAYRLMAPAELASVVRGTIAKARAEVLEAVAGLLSPFLPEGFSVEDPLGTAGSWEGAGSGLPAGLAGLFGDSAGSEGRDG
jgi:hypothetical protein